MIETELNTILQKEFPNSEVFVENQSDLHAGHAGSPGTGQSHFEVRITSGKFSGMTRVQMHQWVNELCAPLFAKGLHALSLKLSAPKD